MQNLQGLIKENGYKLTKARMAIIKVFAQSREPLDAKKVFKKLKSKKINEVTVYRTLASFENTGILKKVDLRKDSLYFELAREHHHHIVCTNCNRIEDFKNQEIEKLLERIVEKSSQIRNKFKNIKEHSLELFGLCIKCLPAK